MEVLLRLGELTLKSRRSRRRFMDHLINNIEDSLKSNGFNDYEIKDLYGRVYLKINGDKDPLETLSRVFGIVGVVEVKSHRFKDLDDIVSKAIDIYREMVRGKTFGVKTRRVGRHDFRSIDVNKRVGEGLLKYAKKVDLSNPDIWVNIEVRDGTVYYYLREVNGYGGLPIGTEGKALALFSGGFDSPVAAWHMMRRGVEVHFIHFQLGGEKYFNKVLRVAVELAHKWGYGYKPMLYKVDFRPIAREIREKVRRDYRIVILKRLMYRGAAIVAESIDADALVTGESIGQVSSQTLRNLVVTDRAVNMTVFRPLIGLDKVDIIDKSREIGLYEYSKIVEEVCALVEERPVIHADPEVAEEEESKLDMSLVEEAISEMVKYDLRRIEPFQVPMEDTYAVEPDKIPEDALIVDIRGSFSYMLGHIPGSVNMKVDELLGKADEFRREGRKIVVVCPVGLDSVEVVYRLREMGVESYYLAGGYRAYRKVHRS